MTLEKILRNPPKKEIRLATGEREMMNEEKVVIDYDKWKQQIQKLMLGEERLKEIIKHNLKNYSQSGWGDNLSDFVDDFITETAQTISQKMKEKLT